MPFSDEFSDVYTIGIKEACVAAGAYCERVDEQIFIETMLQRIYNQIAKADLIIADMTGRNPNVFYEVGYAHAIGKRTILLTKTSEDIPFDLKHFAHIVYGTKLSILRDELTRRIQWHVQHPEQADLDVTSGIEVYAGAQSLSKKDLSVSMRNTENSINLPLTIHNNSSFVYETGSFKLGFVVPEGVYWLGENRSASICLPDGRSLYMHQEFDTLFPDAFDSFSLKFSVGKKVQRTSDNRILIVIRLFTPTGKKDFNVSLNFDNSDSG